MPVPVSNRVNAHVPNGVTTTFAYEFKIFDENEILVEIDGVTQSGNYTVTGVGEDNGGDVVFSPAPTGTELVISSNTPYDRTTDYQRNGSFLESTVDRDYDRITIQIQQLWAALKRAIKLPKTVTVDQVLPDASTAAERASTVVGFDADGDAILFPAQTGTSLADLAASAGSALIGWIQDGVGAVLITVKAKLQRRVDVLDFVPVALQAGIRAGTEATDLASYIAAAWTYCSGLTFPARLVFQSGRYYASAFPNFAVQDAEVDCEGEVRLRYTGTGVAIDLDGGASGAGVYNAKFGNEGRFIIEAANTATHAIRARAFHAGKVKAKVLGCGNTSAGLKVNFAVCSEFDVIVSVNHEAWFSALRPGFGYDLDQRNSGEFTSYCIFPNPICEGPDIGIQLTATLGNNFYGGTSEACITYGVFASTAANLDKFHGTDFEANGTADVFCQGEGIVFDHCDSEDVITFGSSATKCSVIGGAHKSVLLDVGSTACSVRDLVYNRANDGGTVSDQGNGNRVFNVTNGGADYIDWEADRYIEYVDDFMGDAIRIEWASAIGTDPQCVTASLGGSVLGGFVRLTAGDDAAATMAVNGCQLNAGATQWRMDNGGFEVQFRVKLSAITDVVCFLGMSDQVVALEMPFTLAAGDALTSNATDAFGVLFDTAADTDQWCLVGVANDVDATKQFAGVAPTANVYETWRIQVTNAGVAKFYRNKALIGTAMTGAARSNILLTPYLAIFSRTTATRLLDCDVISLKSKRA